MGSKEEYDKGRADIRGTAQFEKKQAEKVDKDDQFLELMYRFVGAMEHIAHELRNIEMTMRSNIRIR